jgi:hypothetical protein
MRSRPSSRPAPPGRSRRLPARSRAASPTRMGPARSPRYRRRLPGHVLRRREDQARAQQHPHPRERDHAAVRGDPDRRDDPRARPPPADRPRLDGARRESTSASTSINVPLPSRTTDGAAAGVADANGDGLGIAISGSTSLENRYLVDGIDITGLTFGDVGTSVLNDFVEEVEVATGGYQAE